MELQLRTFVAVAEQKNFTRAAEILHTTQPSVSQHIQTLERRMGAKLLDRTKKYVQVNQAGQIVYQYAKEILNLYDQMDRLVSDLLTETIGHLSIGASFTFGEYVLPHAIAQFHETYPQVTPSITIGNTREVVELVASGKLDIGIIEGNVKDERVQVEPFAVDEMVLVCAIHHPLAQLKSITVDDLSIQTWIVREEGSGTREFSDRVFHEYGFTPELLMEFGSTQLIKESVEAGIGISILSTWVIRNELELRKIKKLSVIGTPVTRHFSIVLRRSEFQTKATGVFREFLMERAERLRPSSLG